MLVSIFIFIFVLIFLLHELTTVNYTRETSKHCATARHGNYSSLFLAKEACSTDSNCYAVYDYECDDAGGFRLCDLINKTIEGMTSSCIYVKG